MYHEKDINWWGNTVMYSGVDYAMTGWLNATVDAPDGYLDQELVTSLRHRFAVDARFDVDDDEEEEAAGADEDDEDVVDFDVVEPFEFVVWSPFSLYSFIRRFQYFSSCVHTCWFQHCGIIFRIGRYFVVASETFEFDELYETVE
ncbi:hypothetical protein FOB64_003986 [Candida albicans]|uniref:Uncharacterized protein n=1 Tax=Candida albicans TaxID=5476 RepID=A0A8H6BXM9_CANAX|nr:hypothetical protein FOB64_003986 [Candida albicans]